MTEFKMISCVGNSNPDFLVSVLYQNQFHSRGKVEPRNRALLFCFFFVIVSCYLFVYFDYDLHAVNHRGVWHDKEEEKKKQFVNFPI